MIKVSVLYPYQQGNRFDLTYNCAKDFPLVRQLLGTALTNVVVEEEIGGMTPGSPAPFVAVGHLWFESVAAFHAAFTPHAAEILNDIPNYANSQPTVQIGVVKI
jgi:uncharacterized protein (TIGR02118 family)